MDNYNKENNINNSYKIVTQEECDCFARSDQRDKEFSWNRSLVARPVQGRVGDATFAAKLLDIDGIIKISYFLRRAVLSSVQISDFRASKARLRDLYAGFLALRTE